MESTIVLGDIHGSTYWKEVIKENPDCRYIFLGDYLDPYGYIPNEKVGYQTVYSDWLPIP